MFFAREGKRPQPFQCSVVLGASQLTDVTCARLFALPVASSCSHWMSAFRHLFLLFHHTDKRGEQYECHRAAKNDFGIRFPYRSLVYCKREGTTEGALHAEELL